MKLTSWLRSRSASGLSVAEIKPSIGRRAETQEAKEAESRKRGAEAKRSESESEGGKLVNRHEVEPATTTGSAAGEQPWPG